MGILRDKMITEMELRGFSTNTIQTYLGEVVGFVKFYNRSPLELGEYEIKKYMHYLIKEKKRGSSKIRNCNSALKFLYENTLGQTWFNDKIPNMKKEKKLPVVLDKSEVESIINATNNLKHKTILKVIYSSGLRCGEAASLKVNGIDSKRMVLRVEQGKGKKDRYTILSQSALVDLREYWKKYRPEFWLFPGRYIDKPINRRSIHRIFTKAKTKAGITKPAYVHSLRHSFATHLLEAGYDILHIQSLLGHSAIQSTLIYLHIRRKDTLDIVSPLDIPSIPEN